MGTTDRTHLLGVGQALFKSLLNWLEVFLYSRVEGTLEGFKLGTNAACPYKAQLLHALTWWIARRH